MRKLCGDSSNQVGIQVRECLWLHTIVVNLCTSIYEYTRILVYCTSAAYRIYCTQRIYSPTNVHTSGQSPTAMGPAVPILLTIICI